MNYVFSMRVASTEPSCPLLLASKGLVAPRVQESVFSCMHSSIDGFELLLVFAETFGIAAETRGITAETRVQPVDVLRAFDCADA